MANTARPPATHMGRPTEDTAVQPNNQHSRRKLIAAGLLAVLVLVVASVATAAATSRYSISYGETLNSIARDHGTDVATLVGLNDIDDPDMIIAGSDISVPDGDLTSYTIREGDTLATIAAEHGVDIKELIVINKLNNADLIYPGDVLLIYLPVEGDDADVAGTTQDDTEAADEAAETEEGADDASADDASTPSEIDTEPAETPDSETPSQSGQLHLVQNDQTLADIAAQYGVTEAQLIAANALDSNVLTNGMILKIPAAASSGVELVGMPSAREQWPLISEVAAASLATAYWGEPIPAQDLLAALGSSENPHEGFRGDPRGMFGTLDDYGVYSGPLAEALTGFGFTAEAFYADGDSNALTARIDAGLPVVVWVTYNLAAQERTVVENEMGRYSLIPEQHAAVVYGYNDEGVMVIDVGTGEATIWAWEPFMASWSLFDGMGLAIELN